MSYIRTCLCGKNNNMLGWCRTYNNTIICLGGVEHTINVLVAHIYQVVTHPPLLDTTNRVQKFHLAPVLLILRGNALNQILGPV